MPLADRKVEGAITEPSPASPLEGLASAFCKNSWLGSERSYTQRETSNPPCTALTFQSTSIQYTITDSSQGISAQGQRTRRMPRLEASLSLPLKTPSLQSGGNRNHIPERVWKVQATSQSGFSNPIQQGVLSRPLSNTLVLLDIVSRVGTARLLRVARNSYHQI